MSVVPNGPQATATPLVQSVALAAGLFLWLVALCWIVVPGSLLDFWDLAPGPAATSLGLRVAALCAGWGTILLLIRREPRSDALTAVIAGSAVAWFAAAAAGVWSLAISAVGVGILVPVTVEMIFGVAFLFADRRTAPRASDGRSQSKSSPRPQRPGSASSP